MNNNLKEFVQIVLLVLIGFAVGVPILAMLLWWARWWLDLILGGR
ncbi:MAG: hypothetical protein ABIH23_14430 [bacterium]